MKEMTAEERLEWLGRQKDAMPKEVSKLPPKLVWLMIDYHEQDGTPVYVDWADERQLDTDVGYIRLDLVVEMMIGEDEEAGL